MARDSLIIWQHNSCYTAFYESLSRCSLAANRDENDLFIGGQVALRLVSAVERWTAALYRPWPLAPASPVRSGIDLSRHISRPVICWFYFFECTVYLGERPRCAIFRPINQTIAPLRTRHCGFLGGTNSKRGWVVSDWGFINLIRFKRD